MSRMIFVQAALAASFFRAGMQFTREGQVIDVSNLGEGVLDRLEAEPNLHVRDATEAEIAALQVKGDAGDDGSDVHEQLVAAIPRLGPDAYGKNGAPKLVPLREHLSQVEPDLITAEAVKLAFDQLVEAGFKAPLKEV